jgi:FtsZ-interacting cell division protein ZipA
MFNIIILIQHYIISVAILLAALRAARLRPGPAGGRLTLAMGKRGKYPLDKADEVDEAEAEAAEAEEEAEAEPTPPSDDEKSHLTKDDDTSSDKDGEEPAKKKGRKKRAKEPATPAQEQEANPPAKPKGKAKAAPSPAKAKAAPSPAKAKAEASPAKPKGKAKGKPKAKGKAKPKPKAREPGSAPDWAAVKDEQLSEEETGAIVKHDDPPSGADGRGNTKAQKYVFDKCFEEFPQDLLLTKI